MIFAAAAWPSDAAGPICAHFEFFEFWINFLPDNQAGRQDALQKFETSPQCAIHFVK